MSFIFEHSAIPLHDGHLYDHQIDAKRNIFNAWDMHDSVLLQMPTGTGKTYLFSSLIEDLVSYYYQNKKTIHVLIVAHRIELIHQISDSLKRLQLPHGIIQGDHIQCWHYDVQVGSIQSILSNRNIEKIKKFGFDYIVVDEAHHSLAKSYKDLFLLFPAAKKLGVTATPWRLNHESFPPLYSELVTTPQVSYFIEKGRLSDYDYVSIKPCSEIQKMIEGVSVASTGDYVNEELDRTFNIQGIRAKLYESYEKYAQGRKGIIYAINKKHASNIAALYSSKGVNAAAIDCDTPKEERDRLVRAFKTGHLQVLVNVEIFTEGFDCPDASFIQLARPTKSLALYLQQVGRGLRVHKDKDKTIILDNVGLYNFFGLPSANRQWHRHFNGLEADESPSLYQLVQASRSKEISLEEDDEDMVLVHKSESIPPSSSAKDNKYQSAEYYIKESDYGLYTIPKCHGMKTKSELVLYMTRAYLELHPETKYWEVDKMLMRFFNLDRHAVRSVVTIEELDEFTLNDEEHLPLIKDVLWDSDDTYFILSNQFDSCPISMVNAFANQFGVNVIAESLPSIQKHYPDFPIEITDEDTKDEIVKEYESSSLSAIAAKFKHPTNEIRIIIEDDTSYRVPRIPFDSFSLISVESFKEFTEGGSPDSFLGFSLRGRLNAWYEENKKLKELSPEEQEKFSAEKLIKSNRRLAKTLLLKHTNLLLEEWDHFKNKKSVFVYLMMIIDLYGSVENSRVADVLLSMDDYVDTIFEEAKRKFLPEDISLLNIDKAIIELDKTYLLTIVGKDKHYHCILNDEFVFLLKLPLFREIIAQTILMLASHPSYIMHDPVHCEKVKDFYSIEQSVVINKSEFNMHHYSKHIKASVFVDMIKQLEGAPYLPASNCIYSNIVLRSYSDTLEVINELLKSSKYLDFRKKSGIPPKVDSSNCLSIQSTDNNGNRRITYMITASEDGKLYGVQARPCLRDVWLSILQKTEMMKRYHIVWSDEKSDSQKTKGRKKLTDEEKLEKKKKDKENAVKKYLEQIEVLSSPYVGKVLQDRKGNYHCGEYYISKEKMAEFKCHYFDTLSVEKIGQILIPIEGYKKQVVLAVVTKK